MRKLHLSIAVFSILAVGNASEALQRVRPTLIGILEESPGLAAGDRPYRDVRVVFRRTAAGWIAFPSDCPDQLCLKAVAAKFPPKVKWTATFNGKQVGRVVGRTPRSFGLYASVGQQSIAGSDPPPTVGERSMDYASFLGEPAYRPLVLISRPSYRKPENWKPSRLSAAGTSAVRRAFRSRFHEVENCIRPEAARAKPWPYADSNVVVKKAYSSNQQWVIAEVLLSGYQCDGPPEEAFASQWFVITPEKRVIFLGSNMWLVDSGDYDNDGKSELIFSISAHNRGGYELFYDNFRQHAIFDFSYH